MLDIVVSYQYMQYQEKLMIQIQENCKKLQFGPDLGLLDPKSGRGIFFFFFQKSNFVSYLISLSAIIMYNITKNESPNIEKT